MDRTGHIQGLCVKQRCQRGLRTSCCLPAVASLALKAAAETCSECVKAEACKCPGASRQQLGWAGSFELLWSSGGFHCSLLLLSLLPSFPQMMSYRDSLLSPWQQGAPLCHDPSSVTSKNPAPASGASHSSLWGRQLG